MLRLRVVQAMFGDCLILEYGTAASPRYSLIDGGPPTVYEDHLRDELTALAAAGKKLDLVILSHVDNDHVVGLVQLLGKLRDQRADAEPDLIQIDGLWHNSFDNAIGTGVGAGIPQRLSAAAAKMTTATRDVLGTATRAVLGIAEGEKLRTMALQLGIPMNVGFPNELIRVDDAPKQIHLGNLSVRVVGPTQKNLEELKKKWLDWLKKHEDELADPQLAAMADRSVPNLSSVMLLVDGDGKQILLTGDGRGDHLLDGLEDAGLLDDDGRLHVDLLKLPHHGSDRNVTKKFFERVTADIYVASADGKDGNPDLPTLTWIVEAAKEDDRQIEIVLTNETDSVKKVRKKLPPSAHGYTLRVLGAAENSLTIEMAP